VILREVEKPKSLKDVVYEHLKEELREGRLLPGETFRLRDVSEAVGISTTPLREALVQLQAEGFITLSRGKGATVRPLSLSTIRDIYQLIGAMEGAVILEVCQQIGKPEIEEMRRLSRIMKELVKHLESQENIDAYHQANREFHGVFLSLSANEELQNYVELLKQRLYDFPRLNLLLPDWEECNLKEHDDVMAYLEAGKYQAAASHLQNVHWSFEVQKRFIVRYYESHMEACRRLQEENSAFPQEER